MSVVVCLKIGEQILTLAVLSIIITAPLGAVAILALGPVLLEQDEHHDQQLHIPSHEHTQIPTHELQGGHQDIEAEAGQ